MPPRDAPRLRIGDAERNAVADSLSRHFADGRIDEAELKERLDGVMAAKTGEDLEGFLDDLPPLEHETHAGRAASPPGDPAASPCAPTSEHRSGHLTKLVLLAVGAMAVLVWAHAFWWSSWVPLPSFGWLLVGVIAFGVWRRRRLIRVRPGPRRCTCRPPDR